MFFSIIFACSNATKFETDTATSLEETTEPTSEPSADSGNIPNDFPVRFNEVLSKSDITEDWIEIVNSDDHSFNLSGYGLMDEGTLDSPCSFAEGTVIDVGEIFIVWADDSGTMDNQANINSPFHCNFKLSKDGESIYFIDPNGNQLSALTFPAMEAEQSYARQSDDSWIIVDNPSPGFPN